MAKKQKTINAVDGTEIAERKDNSHNDVTEALGINPESPEAIDTILDVIHSANLEANSSEVLSKYGVNLEVAQIERMIVDHDLDPSSDRFNKDLYNLYMKEYA